MKYINYIIIFSIIIIIYISNRYESFADNINYIKFARGLKCDSHYKSNNNSTLEQCKNLCNNDSNCKIFSFSDTDGCRYSFCNENVKNTNCRRDKQCNIVNSSNNNLFVNKKFKNNFIQNKLSIIHNNYLLDNDILKSKKKWMNKENENKEKMQMLIYQYLSEKSIVLEINSGIGELSVLINSLLNNPNAHFVTEISKVKYKLLKDNKERNDMKYKCFNGIVYNSRIIQKENYKGDIFIKKISSDQIVLEDWEEISTISLSKINEDFESVGKINTIIINDNNNILIDLLKDNINEIDNIKTIIVENHFDYVDKIKLDKYLEDVGYTKQICLPNLSKDKNSYDKKCFYSVWLRV